MIQLVHTENKPVLFMGQMDCYAAIEKGKAYWLILKGEKSMSGLNDFIIKDGVLEKYVGDDQESTVEIPQGVQVIGRFAFADCKHLQHVVFNEGLIRIDAHAFIRACSLQELILPQSLEIIIEEAFSDCTSLERIIFPNQLKKIEGYAFTGCTALKELVGVEHVEEIDCNAFAKCELPADENGFMIVKDILVKYIGTASEVCVPETVRIIGGWAFSDNQNMVSLVIPDSVHTLGYNAVYACSALRKVELSDNIREINGCFKRCRALKEVTFPRNLERIQGSFDDCEGLETLEFPQEVRRICDSFHWCYALKKVDLPANVKNWAGSFSGECIVNVQEPTAEEEDAFIIQSNMLIRYDGKNKFIEIPEGVTEIAEDAFRRDWGETIVFPKSLQNIQGGIWGAQKMVFQSINNELRKFIVNSNPEEISLYIEEQDVDMLLGKVEYCHDYDILKKQNLASCVLDAKCTKYVIRDNAIFDAGMETLIRYMPKSGETTYTMPDTVKIISKCAFSYCTNLTEIKMSRNLQTILDRAFDNMEKAKGTRLVFSSINDALRETLQNSMLFWEFKAILSLYIEEQDIEEQVLLEKESWNSHSVLRLPNIESVVLESACSKYVVKDDTIFDAQMERLIRHLPLSNIAKYTVPETVKKIHVQAFQKAVKLQEVFLPVGIESIGEAAFEECKKLKKVSLPNTLKELGGYVFTNTAITELLLPDGVWITNQYTPFGFMKSCKKLRIPESLSEIFNEAKGNDLLADMKALSEIIAPAELKKAIEKQLPRAILRNVKFICGNGTPKKEMVPPEKKLEHYFKVRYTNQTGLGEKTCRTKFECIDDAIDYIEQKIVVGDFEGVCSILNENGEQVWAEGYC